MLIKLHEYQTCCKVAQGQSVVMKVINNVTKQSYALKRIIREDYLKHISDIMELIMTKMCGPHPNIIQIYGFSVEQKKINGSYIYMTHILMELWDHSLKDEILTRFQTKTHFQKIELLNIFTSLINTFTYLQEKNIAHRDIKPENLLINDKKEVCIIDFSEGIQFNEIKRSATTLVGSPYYMSPELKGFYINESFSPIDEYNPWKSDVYSLGMTLIDISSLSLGEQTPLIEKITHINEIYGERIERFLKELIEREPQKRKDFIEIKKSKNFVDILTEKEEIEQKIIFCKLNEEEKKKGNPTAIVSLKKKIYGMFEKLIHKPTLKEVNYNIYLRYKLFVFIGVEDENYYFSLKIEFFRTMNKMALFSIFSSA